MNQTAVVMMAGRVVADPRFGHTRSGQPFARLRIGVTPRRPDREGEWHDVASSYFTVNCWRRMATNASACLRKGDPVIVWGKLKSRTWVDANGQRHQIIDIEADTICHDTSMGWTHFLRGRTPGFESDETARRDLAAAEEMDSFSDGDGGGGAADDFAEHGLAGNGFAAGGDPRDDDSQGSDPGDAGAGDRDAGDKGAAAGDATASAGEDPFGDGSPFGQGDRFRDGNALRAGEPGESEVPAATATDPVAALLTEAAPF
jgi:single-strand DNA-binding protein